VSFAPHLHSHRKAQGFGKRPEPVSSNYHENTCNWTASMNPQCSSINHRMHMPQIQRTRLREVIETQRKNECQSQVHTHAVEYRTDGTGKYCGRITKQIERSCICRSMLKNKYKKVKEQIKARKKEIQRSESLPALDC